MTDLKKIRLSKLCQPLEQHPRDIDHIVGAMYWGGFECSREQADLMWSTYSSDNFEAGWVFVPDLYHNLINCIRPYFEPVEPPSCSCHCAGGCGDPYAACKNPCWHHVTY